MQFGRVCIIKAVSNVGYDTWGRRDIDSKHDDYKLDRNSVVDVKQYLYSALFRKLSPFKPNSLPNSMTLGNDS